MFIYRKLSTNEVALTVCFTALYVVFGFLKISPIIGLPGQAITAAAIMAPLIGIILGPYIGTLTTLMADKAKQLQEKDKNQKLIGAIGKVKRKDFDYP